MLHTPEQLAFLNRRDKEIQNNLIKTFELYEKKQLAQKEGESDHGHSSASVSSEQRDN